MHQNEALVRISNMGLEVERVLHSIPQEDLPVGLFSAVLLAILQERKRTARIKFGIPAFIAAVSLISSVAAAQYALAAFSQSTFINYVSLAFTDTGAIASYWQDFSLSLIESVPVAALAVLLAFVFVLIYSARITMRNSALASYLFSRKALVA